MNTMLTKLATLPAGHTYLWCGTARRTERTITVEVVELTVDGLCADQDAG